MENQTQTAATTANAAQTTQTQTSQTQTSQTQTTNQAGAANAGQQSGQAEKTFTQADLDRIVKERLDRESKKHSPYKDAYEAMMEAGLIDKESFASPADVINYIKQAQVQTAKTKAEQTGDTAEFAKLTAQNAAKAEALDVRIDFAAESLAEKDPLYADVLDHMDEVRPIARLFGGDVKKAYRALFGDELAKKQSAAMEAKILADLEAKKGRGVESGDAGGEGAALGLTAEEIKFAKAIYGMTPQEWAAFKKTDNYGDYQKMKKK